MTKSKGVGRGGVRSGAGRASKAAKVDWDAVGRAYFNGKEALDDTLDRLGLSHGMLLAYATAHHWIKPRAQQHPDAVDEMASELAVRMWEIDGVTKRAKCFVAAMTVLGVTPEHIAPSLGISEKSLRSEFAKELSFAKA